ncbi:hypothetical protein ACIPSA_36295 [Streptomyces sp. NPDC086549]
MTRLATIGSVFGGCTESAVDELCPQVLQDGLTVPDGMGAGFWSTGLPVP